MASYGLGNFWKDLVAPTGQKVLYVIGDSIDCMKSQYSLLPGWKDYMPIAYNGVFIPGDAADTVSWGYTSGQGTPSTNRVISPLGTTYGGMYDPSIMTTVTGIPIGWRELSWGTNPTNCAESVGWVNYINQNASGFGRMAGRNSWLFAEGSTVTARVCFLANTRNIGAFNVVGRRYTDAGSGSAKDTVAYAKSATDDTIIYKDASCSTASTPVNQNVGAFVNGSASFSAGSADSLGFVGARYMSSESNGVLIVFLSFSSWTTGDHLYTSGWTNTRMSEVFTVLGQPTHLYYKLGINVNDGARAGSAEALGSGSYTNYIANLKALDARIRSCATSKPLSCFASTYKTSSQTATFFSTMVAGLTQLAASDSRYSFLDIYNAVGGDNFPHTTFLQNEASTYLHPTSEGARRICGAMSKDIMKGVQEYTDLMRAPLRNRNI